ncbi:MAG: hypothetical protein ACR2F6_11445 [Mycobacteriales bacterium]
MHTSRLGRPFWLPPWGVGNGLPATGWAPIADVPERLEKPLLRALRTAQVAACAANVRSGTVQFWVDSLRYATAEDIVRRVMIRGSVRS